MPDISLEGQITMLYTLLSMNISVHISY